MVTLSVSRKRLAKETAVTAKRHKIGISAQRDILANVINVGGGDIEEFSLSNKTVRNAGTSAVRDAGDKIKEDFKKFCVENHPGEKFLIVHFDGKALAQYHDKVKSVKKRISVIASSPYLSSDQVLGVPITASNSGKHQKEVVVKELQEWEIMPFLLGLGFDTTSDNTGKNKGAVVLIEKTVGEALWWLACPHHFYEIHVKKVARVLYGDTTSPDENIYKKLKDKWNDIIDQGIDYENLTLFDWDTWDGTFLADQARSVIVYLQTLLDQNTFPRDDLKELLQLVLVYLGFKVDNFTFHYPGAVSHARFLMQSIYSIKISLLSKQLSIYTDLELENIKEMALFVSIFHAPWYLKCPLPTSAPMLHLHSISQMYRATEYIPNLAPIVLQSIFLHLWYITPQSIPLALLDDSLSADERSLLAVGLANTPKPDVFPRGKPLFPDLTSIPDEFWKSGRLPDLSTFLGPESWLIFDRLGLKEADLDWLQLDPSIWESKPSYKKFKNFIHNLTIVNDPAERGVGLIKEYIATYQNEKSCQDNLLAVSKHRSVVKKDSGKKSLAKIGLV